jgi:tetratricopeptide (TPR) repeat protein
MALTETRDRSRPARASSQHLPGVWAPLLLVALVLATYIPTLRADFVNWDDGLHVYENPHILEAGGYRRAWRDWREPAFYPLTFTMFFAEWRLGGGAPWIFHATNVLVHAANAVQAGLVARALGLSAGAAWAAAGLWALHPIHVTTVAWVTEQKNLLYTFFYFAALLAYARIPERPAGRAALSFALFVVLTAAALLSKATAVTLPIAAVLLHAAQARRIDRRAGIALFVAFGLALGVGLLHLAREHVTAPIGFGARVAIAARAGWFYVGKFLWPADLLVIYPKWPLDHVAVWGPAAFVTWVAVLAVAVRRRRTLPTSAWTSAGFYAVNLALVSGVVWFPFMWRSFVSNHLAYLPSFGLAALVALGGARLFARFALSPRVASTATVVAWALLAASSYTESRSWRDSETLWRTTLAANPDCEPCHGNLGVLLAERGDFDAATAHYEKALRLTPGGQIGAKVARKFADARRAQHRLEDAARLYELALTLDPQHAVAAFHHGNMLLAEGRNDDAVARYRQALAINPESVTARINLGVALRELGRLDNARAEFEAVLHRAPGDVNAIVNLGMTAAAAGEWQTAVSRYSEALGLETDATRRADIGALLGEALGRDQAPRRAGQ